MRTLAQQSDDTPLAYYSPALTEYNSVLTIEFGFDEFDDTIFRMIGQAFTQAAGIPLFASAGVYLLAAGAVTKLATNVATLLLAKKPIFEATEPIQVLRAGTTAAKSGFALIAQDDLESRTLDESHVNDAGELVNDAGEQYRGPIPFVVVSYDGREVDAYENLTPTAAAATTLDRFYSIRDNEERELSLLMDSLKLYNDLKFRRRADELLAEMGELEDGSEKYNRKKVEYDVDPWERREDGHRARLEGWVPSAVGRIVDLHNLVHVWIGGDMGPGTSPNDPAFFLNHCNVDRIWEAWQDDWARTYSPGAGEGPVGHRIDSAMFSLIGQTRMPADVLDPTEWCGYDSLTVA